MESMPISKFKATCLAVLDRVRKTGQPVLITRRGVPVAQVVPPPLEPASESAYGSMKGRIVEIGDIVEPVADIDEWEAWSGRP